MANLFVCPICGNNNPNSIGYLNGKPYCRACISFISRDQIIRKQIPKRANIFLEYQLSEEQNLLSQKLILNYKNGIDTLVYAVCGAGKTEISLGVIKYAINCGEKVAFAVPRKDVVIELHNRLKKIFKFNKVVAVYGGHHEIVDGDIIVLTTHQLYRYKKFFSLIILDEIDAFPFKGDPVLRNMFFNALDGNYIMMSATPTKDVIELFQNQNKDILRLDIRFHRNPLPVPVFYNKRKLFLLLFLIKKIKSYSKNKKQVFIFAPTINECESLYLFISLFCKKGTFVHSKCIDRKSRIDEFRNKKFDYLVTTSVLERGVTVKDLQVIVFDSDNKIYDKGTLIQIAGRAGRKIDAPKGDVYFLSKRITKAMIEANESIEQSNKALQDMLQTNK